MISSLLRRPFIAGLAVLAIALGVLLAFEIGEASRQRVPPAPVRTAAAPQAKLLPPITATPPDQAYPETVARPLFTPTRRPAPTVAAAAAPAFNRGQFQLLGVIIAGKSKTAMLKEKASGRVHRVEEGREVNGLKVAGIERESVTLALGGESEKVPLQVQKATPGAPQPAAATGPFGGPAQAAPHAAPPPAPPQPPVATPAPPTAQLSPGAAAFLGIAPGAAGAPAGAAPNSGAALTPEELLARRRARRAQPNQ